MVYIRHRGLVCTTEDPEKEIQHKLAESDFHTKPDASKTLQIQTLISPIKVSRKSQTFEQSKQVLSTEWLIDHVDEVKSKFVARVLKGIHLISHTIRAYSKVDYTLGRITKS